MLSSRIVFVTAFLTFFHLAIIFSSPACAGEIRFQEQPNAAAEASTEKIKPEAKERLELLMKYKFDRTPQGMLEAWSSDKVKKKKKKTKNGQKSITAEVINSHKDFIFLQLKDEKSLFKKDQILNVLDDQKKVLGKIKILTIEGRDISARAEKQEATDSALESKPESDEKEKGDNPQAQDAESGIPEVEISDADSNTITRSYTVDVVLDNQLKDVFDSTADSVTDEVESAADDADAGDDKNIEVEKKSEATKPQPLAVKIGDEVELQPIDLREKAKAQTERLQTEVKDFARDVSLGNWDKVSDYLSTKIKDRKKAQKLYVYMLDELIVSMPEFERNGVQKRAQAEARGESPPKSFLSPLDVLALAEISPEPISIIEFEDRGSINNLTSHEKARAPANTDKSTANAEALNSVEAVENADVEESKPDDKRTSPKMADDATSATELALIAKLLQQTIETGYDMKPFFEKIREGTPCFGGQDLEKCITAANLLVRCNLYDEAEKLVPAMNDEKFESNIYVLRIWKQIVDIRYEKKHENKWLKAVWEVNQNIFLTESSTQSDIDGALARLIDIAPLVDKDVGQKWLDDSFVESPERGVQILAALGKLSAQNLVNANSNEGEDRLRMLKLQNRAVEKVLEVSPKATENWLATLTLLASNWIAEAKIAIEEAPNGDNDMEVDRYGNYYWNRYYNKNTSSKNPIKIVELIPLLPSDKWQSHISPLLLTEIKMLRAQLHMHIKEYDESFALIKKLAGEDKKVAKEMAEEFVSVWTSFNDPNSDRNQRNNYMYSYGYNQKAESIPLTRSKQDRSLTDLAKWAAEIRSLPVDDIDEDLLVTAFQTCYSAAEVFSTDRIEAVLGEISELKPETIATLSQTMRVNLSGQWRSVKKQEENKTKRTAPEIIREVYGGYFVALDMTQKAVNANPDNWQLQLAKACLEMDQNEFQKEILQSGPQKSEYSELRKNAMKAFSNAAQLYIQQADDLDRNELDTDVFDRWFYASLGAVDLGQLTAKTLPINSEFPKIKAAIEQLPPELAEIHMSQFANNLFARMGPIPPELKFRYLEKGFEIVGDHPRAWEAKELYQYYKDLVGEIKLDLTLDGDSKVGTDMFGVYVNLVHTAEIEREAGGFSKYVQNQNQARYSYNYGRPKEDYQDKFADGVEAALQEHFDVQSITFMSEDGMESRPTNIPGWRITPYAYIALQAKGSEKDRVPPVSLDLDFLDTSGFVVIPVESTELVINCSSEPTMRPFKALEITRTLDERQIDEGKLIMEVSAKAKGLIPELDQLIDIELKDWTVAENGITDQGCLPTSFDMESPQIQILSDRSWSVEYKVKDEAAKANQFAFADVKFEAKKNKIQRYDDADLVEAESVITLERDLAKPNYAWLWISLPLVAVLLIGVGCLVFFRPTGKPQLADNFEMPAQVNAFTVLSLLKDIKQKNGIDQKQRDELNVSINRIEQFYFGEDEEAEPGDLGSLASTWVSKAKRK